MRSFLLALQFLTIFPPVVKEDLWPEDMGRSTAFYPLVGALIGGALWGTAILLWTHIGRGILAFLLLAEWVVGTGALHVDGFLDACDGLFGGYTPEKRLGIMRDVHTGAFAVAGAALLFIGKYAGLQALRSPALLLLPPVLGRWGMVLAIHAFPYARPEGLGKRVKEGTNWKVVLAALGFSIALVVPFRWRGVLAWIFATTTAALIGRFSSRRLGGGLTGDIYGAVCEIVELAILLVCIIN